jgi:hypothetical protein
VSDLRRSARRLSRPQQVRQSPLPPFELPEWQQTILTARKTQLDGQDLVERLLQFVSKSH